ncbi:MAG TPA: tail fiber protein [Candidatus Angelobacter sp.]|jgi:microcystin-dependent protein|nr:tail fiber protein [Candidatus Angelobacter sp.]
MANPFVAEIRIFAGNFAPTGWATCDGQLLPISQNTALFSLLGTMYGGDGRTTFALPNLQGSAPMQQGQGPGLSLRSQGEIGGEQTVTLLQTEMPAHNHNAVAASGTGLPDPTNNVWASGAKGFGSIYSPSVPASNVQMSPFATSITGGNLPHNNMMPYLCLTFIIALQGVFPPRS